MRWPVTRRAAVLPRRIRVLVLGSFPPRECGIATFTKDVMDSLTSCGGATCEVVAVDEPGGESRTYCPAVAGRLTRDDRASYGAIASLIDAHPASVLLAQHEYGLFAGEDGESFVDLIAAVRLPVVVTLHTVLPTPNAHHRAVAQRICDVARSVVVLSHTAKELLQRVYDVRSDRIRVIPHGVPDVPFQPAVRSKARLGLSGRTLISTFGLLSRGKGLEDAIEAMCTVVAHHPEALYLILGQTHPLVRQQEGESYRESLHALVAARGLERHVSFVNRYLSYEELVAYLLATDIYLTPYLNRDQIVSGTLAYAVGCGKAIVSTPYLYAQELLAGHRGVLCRFRDADSMAAAIVALLDAPARRHAIERRAYEYGRRMTWPHLAESYMDVFRECGAPGAAVVPCRDLGSREQLLHA
jgi:glycosyltransferase involved in cell wall biosynthesis